MNLTSPVEPITRELVMIYILLTSAFLFWFGYYVGNQVGRVAHIREHLRNARSQHQRI